jgi:hypothetical protein
MSWFRNVSALTAVAALGASVACGGSSSSSTTAPSPTTYTEQFSGSLAQGGIDYGPADSPNHFTVHQPGNIDYTLTDIQPITTITLGFGLGIWDTTAQTCALVSQVTSTAARLNQTLAASVTQAGELCVGVFDVGNIGSDTITYKVTINHT